jgi:dihydroorotase-like cyclic amidohydrolase
MSASMRIVNGKVYDPANNINGEIKEICIRDGKIVDSVSDEALIIDAQGMAIMPGGVDIHCHIEDPKLMPQENYSLKTIVMILIRQPPLPVLVQVELPHQHLRPDIVMQH